MADLRAVSSTSRTTVVSLRVDEWLTKSLAFLRRVEVKRKGGEKAFEEKGPRDRFFNDGQDQRFSHRAQQNVRRCVHGKNSIAGRRIYTIAISA